MSEPLPSYGSALGAEQVRRLAGHPEQVVGAELLRREDGSERGVRIVRLRSGAVEVDVVVDRALAGHPGLEVRRHVLDGSGASLLTEFSTAVDLVVVGSRGRGGFAGLLLGSTSDQVVHHAPCPVTVIRAGHGTRSVGAKAAPEA